MHAQAEAHAEYKAKMKSTTTNMNIRFLWSSLLWRMLFMRDSYWNTAKFVSLLPNVKVASAFQISRAINKKWKSTSSKSCISYSNSSQRQPRGSQWKQEGRRLEQRASGVLLTSSTAAAAATVGLSMGVSELPDSLDDAAEIAAKCCIDLVQTGGRTRCRVDIDTSAGDETYTLLKLSTQFMQKFTSALCYSAIPGLAQHRQDQLTSLIQAKAELNKLIETDNVSEADESTPNETTERIKQLQQIIADGGIQKQWEGDIVRIFFPDEGNAALARRDWQTSGPEALVPPCVQFSALGGVQVADTSKDVIVLYFCPRASEAHWVEEVLARYEQEGITNEKLQFSVFVNPALVDMGVTGYGMAGRRLRERLIDTIPNAYYLRTLSWGALTRVWPRDFTVWQEDEAAIGGYRMIAQRTSLPSNPEVEDIYDIENNIQSDPTLSSGPGTFMGALNAFGDFVQGMTRL